MNSTPKPARPGKTWLPLLVVTLGFTLIPGYPSYAHRPYFTQVGSVVLPDGQRGEMRLLKGDGIFFADPARILVLDQEGRLLARSYQSTAMVLLCDRDQRSCSGYDGFRSLTLDPASFRSGVAVPGLSQSERSKLVEFEDGSENWGFVASWPSIAQVAEGETIMVRQWPRATALLVSFGAAAALLIIATRRLLVRDQKFFALRIIAALLYLAGLAFILLVAFYLALLTGFSIALWVVSFGSGAALVSVTIQTLRRARTAARRRA